ncbi:MAG: rhomboid family intramembrane serine protease [Aigarchaeota archaeon]|nr:rhomboid family intramembrane serine protease [Aigarchaeota archaeon]MDW8092415.1 rhomboid family intramembrane serine protease [Nitrososphaerota archaeon]
MIPEGYGSSRVTLGLLAINVAVFIIGLVVGSRIVISLLGLVPAGVIEYGQYLMLFTSMFVHADFFHIFFNMLALLIFGREVEVTLGIRRFLILYFISGIVGGLSYVYYSYYLSPLPESRFIPAVGASGAIFGLMASFAVLFPNRPLAVFFMFIPIFARAYVVILIIMIVQTILALSMPFSPVAYTAHIGGFLAGFLLTMQYRRSIRRTFWVEYSG